MRSPSGITRVLVVILDGLRADAIPLFPLPHLRRLAERGAYTLAGQTVRPSITPSALTSLLTGVPPRLHGVESDRIVINRARGPNLPLPELLRRRDCPVRAFRGRLPPLTRGVAARVTARLGIDATFQGHRADEILEAAMPSLRNNAPGVTILHWLDADRAGHAHGWGSRAYVRAARELDAAMQRMVETLGVVDDPSTLLIAFADHGGGGATARDHNSAHPLDTTIPIILAGGQVISQVLGYGASLLDIPPTIAWALGSHPPALWTGRPLAEALRLPQPVPMVGAGDIRAAA
ncbi:MAG: alkaline phosphatase family protein [Gemmatimonadales bacterium]